MDFRKVTPDSIQYLKSVSITEQARLYIKLTKLHRVAVQNVWFNQQCKRLNVIPNYINLRTNNNSRAALLALDRARKVWLSEESRHWFTVRDNLKSHLKILHTELSYSLHRIEFDLLDEKAREMASQVAHQKYLVQCNKLRRLTQNRFSPRSNNDQCLHEFGPRVKNLTNTQFTINEMSLLEKGLKHNIAPKLDHRSLEGLAVDAEVAIVTNKKSGIVKSLVANDIQNASTNSSSRGSGSEILALKSLKRKINSNDLVLTKADKGNTIVVMNRDSYKEKVEEVIHGEDFVRLRSDPTKKFKSEVRNLITDSTFVFSNPDKAKDKIVPMNSLPPILYGLPKIHKDNIPIRPVVSYIGAPAYNLAKHLNYILKDKIEFKPQFALKNSLDLIDRIKDLQLPNNAKLISLDVESLFSNVPYKECLDHISDFMDRKHLHPEEKCQLLNLTSLCMQQNYFMFDNTFYQQKEGLAMGSPLSPLMADIFMDKFECQYIIGERHILYYYRYVDDVIICWTGTYRQLLTFVQNLNRCHPKIKFKLEKEQDKSLNFLDLTITRTSNRHTFQIYRKPTHTDTVIPQSSCHPWQHKLAAFYCYIHRLLTVPLSLNDYQKELSIIYQIAITNGYSKQLIDKIIVRKRTSMVNRLLYAVPPERTQKVRSSIAYVGPVSDKISRTLRRSEVNVAFRTGNSLKRNLCNQKEKLDRHRQSGVYKITCPECNSVYIGQTGRSFTARYKEHVAAARHNHPERSHFAKHLLDSGHTLTDNHNLEIIHNCNKGLRLNVLEKLEITRYENNGTVTLLNEQVGSSVSPLLTIFTDHNAN